MKKNITIEGIAQVVHEIQMAFCHSNGETSYPDWENAPEYMKKASIAGVVYHMDNPDADPAASHNNWMEAKIADGWAYGPVKDAEMKTHPSLIPYEDLPGSEKTKDFLVRQTVHSLIPYLDKVVQ